jgi:hypothetical protein
MVDGACRVSGGIPSEIRFEVNLPDQGNGRMIMRRNGSLAGQPTEDAGYQTARLIPPVTCPNVLPGMFHCAGGPRPSDFDGITPLVNWVEAGVAPVNEAMGISD